MTAFETIPPFRNETFEYRQEGNYMIQYRNFDGERIGYLCHIEAWPNFKFALESQSEVANSVAGRPAVDTFNRQAEECSSLRERLLSPVKP